MSTAAVPSPQAHPPPAARGLPPDASAQPLHRLGICVVDLETTGGSPGRSRITEIGAVRMRGLEPVARFATLVDPGCPIPAVVREITGIDDAMVAGAPPIDVALRRFAAFAGDDVIVAHNAPFDLRFLNYERRRLDGDFFPQPWIDTLTLARALLGGRVERHDLATLAAWAGTRVRPAHRALPDAEATAELLARLAEVARERGVVTLRDIDRLVGPQGRAYTPRLALCEELPSRPGVYILRDAQGAALHVGASGNLRRDVRRLFHPAPRRSQVLQRAIAATESVDHEAHGSRLAALLRCDELGRSLRVPSVRPAGGAMRYIALTVAARGPAVRVVATPPAGGVAFGPLRGERQARRAVECLTLLFDRPAPGASARPGRAAAELRALLAGEPRALGRVGRHIERAAAEGRIDPAAPAGRRMVDDLMAVLQQLAAARRARSRVAVLVEEGPGDGLADGFFVSGGRVVARAALAPDDWEPAARSALVRLRAAPAAEGALSPSLHFAAGLIEKRLAQRGAHPAVVRLDDPWDLGDAVAAVGRAVAAACDGTATEPRTLMG